MIPKSSLQVIMLIAAVLFTVVETIALVRSGHLPGFSYCMWRHDRSHLSPGDYFVGTTGINFVDASKPYPEIGAVARGSAAAKADISAHEAILAIDDLDARLMTPDEINNKLSGDRWMPIKLKLRSPSGVDRTVNFLRGTLADYTDTGERHFAEDQFVYPPQPRTGLRWRELGVPCYIFQERRKVQGPVVIEFYEKAVGPCKIVPSMYCVAVPCEVHGMRPRFVSPSHGTQQAPETERTNTGTVMRLCLDDPLIKKAAARLGIEHGPTFLFWLHDQPIVFKTRIFSSTGKKGKDIFLDHQGSCSRVSHDEAGRATILPPNGFCGGFCDGFMDIYGKLGY